MSAQAFALPETMRINGLAEIKESLDPLVTAGEDLEFDATELSSLDTSGLQLIIAAHLSLSQKGKKLTVRNPSDALNKAIEISGAGGILNMV